MRADLFAIKRCSAETITLDFGKQKNFWVRKIMLKISVNSRVNNDNSLASKIILLQR